MRVCSPSWTTPPVIGALAIAAARGRLDLGGCVDAPQMADVARQWRASRGAWKLPLLQRIAAAGFSAKHSKPFGTGDVHDFMHAKLTVADDRVFMARSTSPAPASRTPERASVEDADLADHLVGFVDEVRARYGPYEP